MIRRSAALDIMRVGVPLTRWLLAVLLGLMACSDACPPPEARGGTEAEQAAAEAEAERFMGWMTVDVCVPRIRLGSLRGSSIGKYSPTTRRIKVQEDRPLDEIESTVRHELCHAIQFQHDLDLSGRLFTLTLPLDIPDDERAGETWAYTCQQGPQAAYLVGDTCPDDTPGMEIYGLVREYFDPPPEVAERGIHFDEVGRIEVGDGEVQWVPTTTGGLFVDTDVTAAQVVDLQTGEATAPAPPLDPGASLPDRSIGLRVAVAANGAQGLRLVYQDRVGVTRAGCLRRSETVFASAGELWSVYRDGDDLVWGTWNAEPSASSE